MAGRGRVPRIDDGAGTPTAREPQSGSRRGERVGARSESERDARRESQSEARCESLPTAPSESQCASPLASQSEFQSEFQPESKPESKPESRPASQPASQPEPHRQSQPERSPRSESQPQPISKTAVLRALLDDLREPAVRDLAWLLLSPDLLRAQPPRAPLANPFDTPAEFGATLAWLRALDAAPATLVDDLRATRITRVGRYAEQLLGWFLRHGPAAQLIAASVPVRRAGITLGECDFLVNSSAGARLHWELAVKCYLHAGDDCAGLANFVGPNLKDRFDLKLAHLLNHQLPLSAREEFAALGFAGPWTQQMFVKGWLFYRHGHTPPESPELDPSHGRGWCITRADWPAFAREHARQWRVLPRLEWLAPRRAQAAKHALEQSETRSSDARYVDEQMLSAQISEQTGPAMVAAFAEKSAGDLIECSRGFIVPNDWPEHARRYARQ